ncbi:MAG: molybdopterin-dependent oxidoreductase, partial [Actinomycetes bacterium]
SAVARLAESTGARLAWVPRRAGDRGAIDAGALPNLLPGGRPVTDLDARRETARAWAVSDLPSVPGRDTAGILSAAKAGILQALVVAGVDPYDLPHPDAALAALDAVGFLVSLEQRPSAVTARADVVLPVASVTEKAGTFVDWEGRRREFGEVLRGSGAMPDARVLTSIADQMDLHLGLPTEDSARHEIATLGRWSGERAIPPAFAPGDPPSPGNGEAVLTTWSLLLDRGRLQDGEPHLAGTARAPVARLSAGTAAEIGAEAGGSVTVSTDRGALALPLVLDDMPDRVVWLPTNSEGSQVRRTLGADSGTVVRISAEARP